jgi:hypothetical protein
MRIDEREIDRLSTELNQKEYTDSFFGTERSADFKTYVQGYLQKQDEKVPIADAFPIRMANFLEGGPSTENYTVCVFKIDYDLIGGLSLHAETAYQRKDGEVNIVTAKTAPNTFLDIPSRLQLLAFFKEAAIAIQTRNLDGQMEVLQKQLTAKGYDAPFFNAFEKVTDVKTLLNDHLTLHKDKNLQQIFPVWIGTIIAGTNLLVDERTLCKMRVQYDPEMGFDIDRLLYSKQQRKDGRLLAEKEIKLSSIKELPTKAEINHKVDQAMKSIKKKRMNLK